MNKSKRDRYNPERRRFLSDCLKYGSAFAFVSGLGAISGCGNSAEGASKPPKSISLPEKHVTSVGQNVVAVSKNSNPYELTRKAVEALGGMDKFISKDETVMLLPNMAWDRNVDQAANTHPDVVRAIIDMCKESKAREIGVFCNTCHPAQSSYAKSGVADTAEKAGARIWYVDDRDFQTVEMNGTNLKTTDIYKKLLASDRFINIPIAKVHSLASYTMSMKNLLGAVKNRQVYHPNIHQDLADLSMILKPDLNVIDATRILIKNGPTGGSLADVRKPNIVIAAPNPVSADSVGMSLFDKAPEKLMCLTIAQKLGRGEYDHEKLEIREA
ncbi:MAG: DUF362 domain-containing protein [bacterium]